MYEKKDLNLLKILQKARILGDSELSSEALLRSLLSVENTQINEEEKALITELLNTIVEAKNKASLSKD